MTRRVPDPAEGRRCSRCGFVGPLDAFPPMRRMSAGRSSWCRECARQANRDYRAANAERLNAPRRIGPRPRTCAGCGLAFEGRANRRWCCGACRAVVRASGPRREPCDRHGGAPMP